MATKQQTVQIEVLERLPFHYPEATEQRIERDIARLAYIREARANRQYVKETCKALGIARGTYYAILRRNGLLIAPPLDVPSRNSIDLEAEIKRSADIIASTRLALANEPGTPSEDGRSGRREKEDESPYEDYN